MRSFDEYRARLLENFVILERERAAQQDRARARRQGAAAAGPRQPHRARPSPGCSHEVPDLVEYPSVVAGTFALEFLELPEEVLTTTLIHHQHYFPVEAEDGKLKNAFLAVINTEPDNERTIARNAERVVTARLRDARFFWEADRKATLESRLDRLGTLLFHKKLGSYQEKAERIERLARLDRARGASAPAEQTPRHAAQAARLAKADLTTDMVREFTELQGTMGGIYAREEGLPEEVWKAIYFHYLPIGVEADAPPSRAQLGKAARHLGGGLAGRQAGHDRRAVRGGREADRLARSVRPAPRRAGRRQDPGRSAERCGMPTTGRPADAGRAGLRSAIAALHGAPAMLDDRPSAISLASAQAAPARAPRASGTTRFARSCRPTRRRPEASTTSLQRVEALAQVAASPEFEALAVLFKRVKNITKGVEDDGRRSSPSIDAALDEPAEARAARASSNQRWPTIEQALGAGAATSRRCSELADLQPPVDRFFNDVLVMADDPALRRRAAGAADAASRAPCFRPIGDISEIAPDEGRQ